MVLCKFCGKEIEWIKLKGKWVPINPDESEHSCVGRRKAARQKYWAEVHADMIKAGKVLDSEYKAAMDRSD